MEICHGCNGKGSINIHVQQHIHGHRICHEQEEVCPICHGSKHATQAQVDAFLNEMIPYHEHINA